MWRCGAERPDELCNSVWSAAQADFTRRQPPLRRRLSDEARPCARTGVDDDIRGSPGVVARPALPVERQGERSVAVAVAELDAPRTRARGLRRDRVQRDGETGDEMLGMCGLSRLEWAQLVLEPPAYERFQDRGEIPSLLREVVPDVASAGLPVARDDPVRFELAETNRQPFRGHVRE